MSWWPVIATVAGLAALKQLGTVLPRRITEQRLVATLTLLVPIALIASVTASQAFSTGHHLAIDARMAGLAAAVLALVARAPFIVVVLIAGATAAVLRALT
jgi:hypothetical protein